MPRDVGETGVEGSVWARMLGSNGWPKSSSLARTFGIITIAALLIGFVAAVLAGSPARANPGIGSPASPTSCPNQAYNTSTTIANCRPTTTTGSLSLTLTVSYKNGHLMWRACAGASTQGSAVQFYVDGNPTDTGTIEGNGCTPDRNVSICLASGQHNAVATDSQYSLVAKQTFTVQDSGCHGPTVAAASSADASGSTPGSSGASGSKPGGFLAFTGINVALMLLGAGLLIGLGYAILRVSRRRRHAA